MKCKKRSIKFWLLFFGLCELWIWSKAIVSLGSRRSKARSYGAQSVARHQLQLSMNSEYKINGLENTSWSLPFCPISTHRAFQYLRPFLQYREDFPQILSSPFKRQSPLSHAKDGSVAVLLNDGLDFTQFFSGSGGLSRRFFNIARNFTVLCGSSPQHPTFTNHFIALNYF